MIRIIEKGNQQYIYIREHRLSAHDQVDGFIQRDFIIFCENTFDGEINWFNAHGVKFLVPDEYNSDTEKRLKALYARDPFNYRMSQIDLGLHNIGEQLEEIKENR